MFGAVGFTPINFLTKLRASEGLLWACCLLLFNRLKLIKFNQINLTDYPSNKLYQTCKLCTNRTKSIKFKNMLKPAPNVDTACAINCAKAILCTSIWTSSTSTATSIIYAKDRLLPHWLIDANTNWYKELVSDNNRLAPKAWLVSKALAIPKELVGTNWRQKNR